MCENSNLVTKIIRKSMVTLVNTRTRVILIIKTPGRHGNASTNGSFTNVGRFGSKVSVSRFGCKVSVCFVRFKPKLGCDDRR